MPAKRKSPQARPKAAKAAGKGGVSDPVLAALERVEGRLTRLEALLGEPDPGRGKALVEPGLVGGLNRAESDVLETYGRRLSLKAGELLFAEGDPGEELFVVVEGELETYKNDLLGNLRLAEIRAGGVVGDMALIEGKPRSANVRALKPSTLLGLHKAGYERLKRERPRIAVKFQEELLRLMSGRLRSTTEKYFSRQS